LTVLVIGGMFAYRTSAHVGVRSSMVWLISLVGSGFKTWISTLLASLVCMGT